MILRGAIYIHLYLTILYDCTMPRLYYNTEGSETSKSTLCINYTSSDDNSSS